MGFTTDKEERGFIALIAIVGLLPLLLLDGFMLKYLWAWFIATTFHVAPISFGAAIGLSIFTAFLTYRFSLADQWVEEDQYGPLKAGITRMVFSTAASITIFIMGWFVHFFV